MASNDDLEVRGLEITRDEIDEFLTEIRHGTLSLASDGRAYGVPISFGYDGDRVFMNLIVFGDCSRKVAYLSDTEEACLTAMDVHDKFDWRSDIVIGEIESVDDAEIEYHESVLDDNGWFPMIYSPTEAMTGVERVVMEPSEICGHKGEANQTE